MVRLGTKPLVYSSNAVGVRLPIQFNSSILAVYASCLACNHSIACCVARCSVFLLQCYNVVKILTLASTSYAKKISRCIVTLLSFDVLTTSYVTLVT